MFGVSRQVYYRSEKRRIRKQDLSAEIIGLVMGVRMKMPRIGGRKLYHILKESLEALSVGRDKLFQILKANHLLVKPKRSYHITTNSHHRFRKHKDLTIDMKVSRPEQLWVSDITYLGNRKEPCYLALVTDAYSKKIVGYDVSNSLSMEGSLRALKMAILKRIYKKDMLIHHSDRGLQYCCDEYQQTLIKNNINCSMTESYDPYRNAVAERVNGILKQEFIVIREGVKLSEMKKMVSESVNIYNNIRPHHACFMNTPKYMHRQSKIEIRTYKRKNSSRNEPTAI
ncbi:IS3 family transposase [Pedobacter sp. CFBP9032]|uniref:IS3 family transposase n=1 Tax=Pedobacter sp. CFBP9032 TaxID=3096539 RepID=UPI002A6AF409|nr:IS3 family transposase [Pedobacter sp. CFBP9032]MDY0907787.1 IS3 family transposase [Pedobacter sp. CFBP9032]